MKYDNTNNINKPNSNDINKKKPNYWSKKHKANKLNSTNKVPTIAPNKPKANENNKGQNNKTTTFPKFSNSRSSSGNNKSDYNSPNNKKLTAEPNKIASSSKPVNFSSFKKNREALKSKPIKGSNNFENKRPNNKVKRHKHIFNSRIKSKEYCVICSNEINDIVTSLSMKVDNIDKPAHFDCVLNKIKSEHKLSEKDEIIYKGIGKFMVVDSSTRGDYLSFKIISEIDFENLDKRPDWRKKIFDEVNEGLNL